MQIQFGLETEYGITREQPDGIDVVEEAIAVVRSARAPGVRDRWDYRAEDPHQDARGFRVQQLQQDADEASYVREDARRPRSFTEVKSDLVLRNGARLYNDHTHPEYCTPECTTIRELLRQDWAGDALVMQCAAAASGGSDNPIRLYKNNTDFRGHSYGCHENYLLPRSLPWAQLTDTLPAFLVTRQIFAGAGKYGWEAEDRFLQPGFQVSQRSDFFCALQGVETMRERAIINTRDEAHADPARYRRFHVILGDANLSPYATFLKVGTTALVLQALANGAPAEGLPRLADPVAALTTISRDPDWRWQVQTSDGQPTTAVAVQRAYLQWVVAHTATADVEWAPVLAAWTEILDDLERDPLLTADRLDWAAKYRLIEQFRAAENVSAGDPWLRSLDLAYHLLDHAQGLYYGIADTGAFKLPWPLEEIAVDALQPPETTRAALRGRCVEKFGPAVISAEWGGVILADGKRRIELDLRDVFSRAAIDQGRAVLERAQTPADLLALPFAKTT